LQINTKTKKERHVRLQPPYRLEQAGGANESGVTEEAPMDVHFVFLEGETWMPFLAAVQGEFALLTRCRPIPDVTLFDIDGRAYRLEGFAALACGGGGGDAGTAVTATATCCRDGWCRKVRRLQGPAEGGGADAEDDREVPTLRRRHTLAFDSNVGLGSRFTRQRATFRFVERTSGCTTAPECRDEVTKEEGRELLLEQWLKPRLPDEVLLPGDVRVENFAALEWGGAGAQRRRRHGMSGHFQNKAQWMPLELELELPSAGRLTLPEALEGIDELGLEDYGRGLALADIEALTGSAGAGGDDARCSICFCDVEAEDVTSSSSTARAPGAIELQCGHIFHGECIRLWFKEKRRCPICQRNFGWLLGSQPTKGTMRWNYEAYQLPGHPGCLSMIAMDFDFPQGLDEHGNSYKKRKARGYLPANAQGVVLLELFKVAFRRRAMFGLGHSLATEAYRPTFNIHIKTNVHGGATTHGYPDETYFVRAMEELAVNGITRLDLPV